MSKSLDVVSTGIPPYASRAERLLPVLTFNFGKRRVIDANTIRIDCPRNAYELGHSAATYAAIVRKMTVAISEHDGTGFNVVITGLAK